MKNLLYLIFIFLCFQSCFEGEIQAVESAEGLRPVYLPIENWQDIKVTEARPISRLGKIYYKDEIIFVNEYNQGIHIIDNSDPTDPIPLSFIAIFGNKDIAIRGDILYADNISDLVTLDISDLNNITQVGRVPNIYPDLSTDERDQNPEFPEDYRGYFECVDASKGLVIGWENATLQRPKCWR
ncbi:MAG: hypothetical protein AAF573_08445 [Bacteroidota bacterium]